MAEPVEAIVWRTPAGKPVSCLEKIKVLNQNLDELAMIARELLEDGLLMGCDEAQMRRVLHALVDGLVPQVRPRGEEDEAG